MNRDEIDALLADVISGERSLQDGEVQRLLAAQPELRAEIERVRRLAGELDDVGGHQREFLTSVVEPRAASSRPGRRRWPLVLVAIAAAAAVAIGVWIGRDPGVPARENHYLGAEDGKHFVPTPGATVAAIDRFAWQAVPRGVEYRLTVRERAGAGGEGRLLFQPVVSSSTEWVPDAASKALLVGALEWRVEALDAGNQRVRTSEWIPVTVEH